VLFQAVEGLLKASSNPKFIGMTSGAGSLSEFMDVPIGKFCYGSSKAVLNFMLRRIHFENDWISKSSDTRCYMDCGFFLR
jgi:norsolorinic acid ketoreductase